MTYEGLLHNVERLINALDETLDRETIAMLESEWVGLSQCRKEVANAQLIAQAPVLLEALEELYADWLTNGRSHWDDKNTLKSKIHLTIIKAKGGQS